MGERGAGGTPALARVHGHSQRHRPQGPGSASGSCGHLGGLWHVDRSILH